MHLQENRLLVSSTLVVLLAISVAAQGTGTTEPAPTPASYPWSYNFPPVGLAFTETLQVNVANLPSAFAVISPVGVCSLCSTYGIQTPALGVLTAPTTTAPATATSCTGTITFMNAAGTGIGAPVPFTVAIGQIFSAPLPFSMTGYSGFRGEILASVQGTTAIPSSTVCSLSISLETFDTSTGVTHAFLTVPPALPQATFSAITARVLDRP